MSDHRVRALLAAGVLSLCSLTPVLSEAADVGALLKAADAYRLAGESMRIETRVELFHNGVLQRERRYTVLTRPGRRALVLFLSPQEQGQKVLMLGDEFWIVLPASQRPIRITPLQKLIGDAATGDIATMTWSEDYDGEVIGEELVDGVRCLKLDLRAQRKGVTYPRLMLFIDHGDARPVRADLYVASEKVAKLARFALEKRDGAWSVTAMTLTDMIRTGRETRITYESRQVRETPVEYFNPMFLVRNDVAD